MENELHPAQAYILRTLLFRQDACFTELNVLNLDNDHFTFHINRLLLLALIEKQDRRYRLTTKGKSFANRMDTDTVKIQKQPKVGVVVCGIKNENNQRYYLVQQRLKQPYYGYYGSISGKIARGETIAEAAAREFKEETGLTGEFYFAYVRHKMDYDNSGELLADKIFFTYIAQNVRGKLIRSFEGGKNQWLTRKEIEKLPNLFDDVLDNLDRIENKNSEFIEKKYTVAGY